MMAKRKPEKLPPSPPCYLGFGTVRQCPNLCRGECGYKSRGDGDGRAIVIGGTLRVDPPIALCKRGLHANVEPCGAGMTPADLRAARKALGLTNAEFAQALGISKSWLSDLEAGVSRSTGAPAVVSRAIELACETLLRRHQHAIGERFLSGLSAAEQHEIQRKR